ncbi:MAG: tetratricopeptide repeat protein, partial [Rhodospirillales bacterium]|nr:tetratricopeptide repeat protein [Rhodospirillales bacterium]
MAEPTDMLAREIDEELRRERLLQLWDRYGTYILAAALAVVVGVGGYKFYESRKAQANEAASTRYIIGLRDFAMNKPGEAQRALDDLAANAPTGYATLSRLRLAGYDQAAGNTAEAVSAYGSIAKDSAVDPILAEYAQLQIAMLKLESASFTELKNRLTPLAAERSAWRFSARELLGMAAYKAGLVAEARSHFQRLVADRTARRGLPSERVPCWRCWPKGSRPARRLLPQRSPNHLPSLNPPRKTRPRPRARPTRTTRETRIVVSQDSTRKPALGRAGTCVRPLMSAVLLLCASLGAGCGDSMPKLQDLNPFAEKEVPLQGKRVSVIQQENITTEAVSANRPIVLPQPHANDAWSQPGGTATNAPGHLALNGSVKSAWSANVGTGSSFYGKLTASPIVYDGKVFTLDAAGKVTALSASGGAVAWRVSTTPPNEKDQEGFGGGLAADSGRVYAATGFGVVVALDAKGGKKLWEKNLGSPLRASPTAAGERVFVVTKEGKLFCLSGS